MSDVFFPSTQSGYVWDSKKKPVFNTIVHSSATGCDVRISLYSQPVYEFMLSNQWLTKADKDALIGFFIARKGAFDTFLYFDEDCTATRNAFAIGDGETYIFQLAKSIGSGREVVNIPYLAGVILYLDGSELIVGTHYTINYLGVITMIYTPYAGMVLSWSGTAYYRCAFLEDALEYNQFADRLYDCNEVKFKGSLAAKL